MRNKNAQNSGKDGEYGEGKNEKEMENTFVKILNLFEDTELRKN